jgi:predicted component of type VI protein secretion system
MLNLSRSVSSQICRNSTSRSYSTMAGVSLDLVVDKLNEFAPESIAEKWDNVGLLIEPYTKR